MTNNLIDPAEPQERDSLADVESQSIFDYSTETPSTAPHHDPYLALRFRDFRFLLTGRFIGALGEQMISVAIGWELYERTNSELTLGLVGLVQIVPVVLLSLLAGQIADQYDRKRVVMLSEVLLALCAVGLTVLSYTSGSLVLIYVCLLGIGIARAFGSPATSAIVPQTVPPTAFTSAATWSSSAWQLASVIGPALGGLAIGLFKSATVVYAVNAVGGLCYIGMIGLIRGKQVARARESISRQTLTAGISFIRRDTVILSAITLDMFAVLLGGAVALMPVFAKDILKVGPEGLGLLQAAPSIGALLMAFALAHLPPFTQAGKTLLWSVVGFGAATIVFGLSQNFWLSMLMLLLVGALDNISVVIRSTLLLVRPPDAMRGRISAVNSVFVGLSNQLGMFESGVAAWLVGPVVAVVGGGIGTILVVMAIIKLWPSMAQLEHLNPD